MNFAEITIHTYLEILLEWILEFELLSFLFFLKFPKKRGFAWIFPIGILIIAGLAYPLSVFYSAFGETIWGRVLVYLALFALVVGHSFFLYKESPGKIIVFNDMAYFAQNTFYQAFSIIYMAILNIPGINFTALTYKLSYYGFFALFVIIFNLTLIRAARKKLTDRPLRSFVVRVSFGAVFVLILLCSAFDICFSMVLPQFPEGGTVELRFLEVVGKCFALIIDGLVLSLFFFSSSRNNMLNDIADLNYIIAQSEEQYRISEETIQSINIKCHDIKHRINQIVGDSLPSDALNDINESIVIYDSGVTSGNKVLDVILTDKTLICEANHIVFSRMVDGQSVSFLSHGDLCSLFGNILDNAIEATKKIQEEGKRYINLVIRKMGEGIAKIECENYFEEEITFEGGLPLTTKDDKFNHGFGMASIANIVEHYNGTLSINAENKVFSLDIVLFGTAK